MNTRFSRLVRLSAGAAMIGAMLLSLPAYANLVHRYTFNDKTAADSVGTADGTLMGTAAVSFAENGSLNLTGGGAGNSFVDLPDGIASAASVGGVNGEITTEAWVNVNANANWAVIFSFGNSGPGVEDNDGSDGDYWQLIPQNGSGAPNALRTTTHRYDTGSMQGAETFADDGVNNSPLATGSLQHVVNVLNKTNNTNELYVNGVLVGTSALQDGFDPNTYGTIGDTQNWLGRSQWGDPSFNGSYDEFCIYDHALTAQEVMDDFNAGPDPASFLTLVVNTETGLTSIRNDAAFDIDFDYYEINSPAGALNPTGWNSLDSQNIDAIDGSDPDSTVGNAGTETWEEAGGSNDMILSELFVQAGSTMTPGASLTLGTAFDPTVFGSGNDGDLSFSFGSVGDTLLANSFVDVVYVTGSQPGDFDGDGDVDGHDFLVWQRNPGVGSLSDWQNFYGAGSSVATAAAVPEPTTLGLIALGSFLGIVFRRRSAVALCGTAGILAVLSIATTASASSTNDRLYMFGEEDLSAFSGGGVGDGFIDPGTGFPTTFDSVGTSGLGNFQDLFVRTDASGNDPKYIAPGNAALPGSTLAAKFDGNDFLYGRRLGLPSSSDPAVDNPANGDDTDLLAPEDYSNINNRGFQVWVKPDSATGPQSIVLDTNQHGLRISNDGKWSMRYDGEDFDSTVNVVAGQWNQFTVVRPTNDSGARMYMNEFAISASPGGYNGGDNARLVVGANTSDDDLLLGMSEFFSGTVDELSLFVLGVNNGNPATDYGTFDPAEDIPAIASALAGNPQGDLNLDGNVNSTDINTFLGNWLTSPKVFNTVAVGDLDTYKMGDLNFSGTIDLDDAFLLHEGIQLQGGVGLDFSLLSVPEPASLALVSLALGGLFIRRWNH